VADSKAMKTEMACAFMGAATIDNKALAGIAEEAYGAQLDVRAHRLARPRGAFLAAEVTLLTLALLQTAWGGQAAGTLILIASCALFFHVNNLDGSIVTSESPQFWMDVVEAVLLGILVSSALFYLFPSLIPRTSIALAAGLLICLLPAGVRYVLRHLITRGKFVEEILIVGTGELPAKLHRALGDGFGHSMAHAKAAIVSAHVAGRRTAVHLTELPDCVAKGQISRVVIAELDALRREKLAAVLLDCRLRGLQVNDALEFYEELSGKIWVEALNPQWFVYTNGFDCSQAGACLKRCFDLLLALLLTLSAAPLLAVIAIAIKLDSAGPVFFRQVRVGLHGKTFVIYKFRSMRQDAERESGPAWAAERDERVTRIGRFLRNFRLDELPQAFNVLRGDMSMVGPRPERPCFVSVLEKEIPYYSLRHYMKPGITGWAQIKCRYGSSIADSYEKLQYDFYYAKNRSLGCDTAILLKTIRVVLLGRGR
jgi:sugar transferase (PEP-CTERM system associated)